MLRRIAAGHKNQPKIQPNQFERRFYTADGCRRSRLGQQGEELARIARFALKALVVQRPPPPPDDLDVHLAGGGFPRRATVAQYVHVGRVLLELSV